VRHDAGHDSRKRPVKNIADPIRVTSGVRSHKRC
jgi:hypothetical protein